MFPILSNRTKQAYRNDVASTNQCIISSPVASLHNHDFILLPRHRCNRSRVDTSLLLLPHRGHFAHVGMCVILMTRTAAPSTTMAAQCVWTHVPTQRSAAETANIIAIAWCDKTTRNCSLSDIDSSTSIRIGRATIIVSRNGDGSFSQWCCVGTTVR